MDKNKVWIHSTGCLLAALILLGPTLVTAEVAEPGRKGDEILWLDPGRGQLLFVPQSVFDQRHVGDLPLRPNSTLEFRLDVQRHPEVYKSSFSAGVVPECWPADTELRQGSGRETKNLASLLSLTSEVYVGEVTAVLSGWNFRSDRVGMLAMVEVSERLRAESTDELPPVAEVLWLLFDGGRVTVDGTELCDEVKPGLYRPRPGETVLVGGYRYPHNPTYFEGQVFPIRQGTVLPQPLPALEERQGPVDLENLRNALREPRGDQRDVP